MSLQDFFKMNSPILAFVDECGDTSVPCLDNRFPVFVVSVCVVCKLEYYGIVVPKIKELKINYFGSDSVLLVSRQIRRKEGPFKGWSPEQYNSFINKLGSCIKSLPIVYLAHAVDKRGIEHGRPGSMYGFALQKCLKKIASLTSSPFAGRLELIIEARGKKEDGNLEGAIRRFMNRQEYEKFDFRGPEFQAKDRNSIGLQLADLAAHPIASNVLYPKKQNRAFNIIKGMKGTDITITVKK